MPMLGLLPTMGLLVMLVMLGLRLLLLSSEPERLRKPLEWRLLAMPMPMLVMPMLELPPSEPDPLKGPLETGCQQRR